MFFIEMQSSGTNTRELLRLFSLEVASTPGTQSEICGWVGWHHWQQVSSITQSQLWAARSISLPWSLLMHSVMSYSGMVAWAQQQSCPHGGGWELPLSWPFQSLSWPYHPPSQATWSSVKQAEVNSGSWRDPSTHSFPHHESTYSIHLSILVKSSESYS